MNHSSKSDLIQGKRRLVRLNIQYVKPFCKKHKSLQAIVPDKNCLAIFSKGALMHVPVPPETCALCRKRRVASQA